MLLVIFWLFSPPVKNHHQRLFAQFRYRQQLFPFTVYNLLICTVDSTAGWCSKSVLLLVLVLSMNGGLSPNTAPCMSLRFSPNCCLLLRQQNRLNWRICVDEMALYGTSTWTERIPLWSTGARDQFNSEDLDQFNHCENGLQVLSTRVTTCYNRLRLASKWIH